MPSRAAPCRADLNRASSTLRREQHRGPKSSVLPSATIALPKLAEPGPTQSVLAKTHLAKTTLQREQQGEPRPSVLLSAAITSPDRPMPHLVFPSRTPPDITQSALRRKQQRASFKAPCCRLQLLPCPIAPSHSLTDPTSPDRNQPCLPSPKRAAGKACALLAAVCSYSHASPRLTLPDPAVPNTS
jgi:hypothetical protein